MCGIAGFYGFKDDNLIKKISKELEHRGPDGEGYFIDNKVTLLNRRLAIIDVKGGMQPIYNEDKSIVTVYNGEIYNYQELRQELAKLGHQFSTNCDTEVIVHAFEEWGEKCFDKFNGMFAVALWDAKKERLILARDHFGIKPLYFSLINSLPDSVRDFIPASAQTTNKSSILRAVWIPSISATWQGLIFASEIKPIIDSGLIKKEPNDKVIYRYLKYRIHDDSPETFFNGVFKLMPGELMIVHNSQAEIRKFSRLEDSLKAIEPAASGISPKETAAFRQKLIDAIKMRLISEVPVGTCLSGGLDSSTVVAVVNQLLKEKAKEAESVGSRQNSFSAVFPNSSNNEEKYIDILLKDLTNISEHKIYPKPEEFFEDLMDFVKTQEEPTISTGPYAQYKVMQGAHKYVKVLLDGQGSDEMMAGYLPYYFVYLKQLLKEKKYSTLMKEAFSSLDILTKYFAMKLISKFGIKKEVSVNSLLKTGFAEKYEKEKFKVTSDNLKQRLNEDIFHNSLPSLLRYEDKNAMRFSIEGRVPFLDFNLLKFIFSLNDEAIIKDGWNKNILRNAVEDLLPDEIRLRRNKIGFTTPEHEWFIRMKNRIYSVFMSESFGKRKYFNQNQVLDTFQKFIEGKNDNTLVFWRFLNMEMWLREFFPKKKLETKVKEKPIEIEIEGKTYSRYPIMTEVIKKGDNISEITASYVFQSINRLKPSKKWFVVVSEKIVAISQGRSYFIWDIKTGFWAKMLSKFVRRTPHGIGLGSPWTMQLAINEIGLPKILLASLASIVTKPFGLKGIFYHVAGPEAAAIDGPTEYSVYPSNVSAKLAPKNPQKVAEEMHSAISNSQFSISNKFSKSNFLGVAIIDANDLGQKVLGNSTSLSNKLIERIFKDNPMGQSKEQTPIVIVTET